METSICCLSSLLKKACCLLRAQILNTADRWLRLVWPSGFLLTAAVFPVIQSGETCKVLNMTLWLWEWCSDAVWTWVVVSIFPMRGKGLWRNGWILWVNNCWQLWVNSWTDVSNRIWLPNDGNSEDQGLQGDNRIHLTNWVKVSLTRSWSTWLNSFKPRATVNKKVRKWWTRMACRVIRTEATLLSTKQGWSGVATSACTKMRNCRQHSITRKSPSLSRKYNRVPLWSACTPMHTLWGIGQKLDIYLQLQVCGVTGIIDLVEQFMEGWYRWVLPSFRKDGCHVGKAGNNYMRDQWECLDLCIGTDCYPTENLQSGLAGR